MAPNKLHGRAFYESIGSPKHVLAPMVDQSEFAWRLLTRSFLPADLRTSILCYTPMFHAKLFSEGPKYRDQHFQPLKSPITLPHPADKSQQQAMVDGVEPFLDGNKAFDRPLSVQFCANDPDVLLESAKIVQPYCDAVDLNLGCPQGIARRGHYGAFLQEDWDTIHKCINKLHRELDIPVTAKFRILESKERTLEYAKMMLDAGASFLTVHGRRREQKGHNTGLADWAVIRYLRENLPSDTVIFANGNILQHDDLARCLEETKADGVMTAEANLYDPTIFAGPPLDPSDERLYWRSKDGKLGGYRMDAVLRRYMDILHRDVLGQTPPGREPLWAPGDRLPEESVEPTSNGAIANGKRGPPDDSPEGQPMSKKQRKHEAKKAAKEAARQEAQKLKSKSADEGLEHNCNFVAMKSHLFHLLRPLVARHHDVRDKLARARSADMAAYEEVLSGVEAAVRNGLIEYENNAAAFEEPEPPSTNEPESETTAETQAIRSTEAVKRCKRPWFICQPYVRPLPAEAFEKGSMQLSKKDLARLNAEKDDEAKAVNLTPNGKVEQVVGSNSKAVDGHQHSVCQHEEAEHNVEVAREGLVCG